MFFLLAQISGKLVTSGTSDVAIVSVYSEVTRLKKMIMIIIIITSNRKTIYVWMAKHFSKKYGNKG